MKQKSGPDKVPAERVVKDIRRQTRRQYSAEEKIRIVLDSASEADAAKFITKRWARRSRLNCWRNNASTSGSSSTIRTEMLTSHLDPCLTNSSAGR